MPPFAAASLLNPFALPHGDLRRFVEGLVKWNSILVEEVSNLRRENAALVARLSKLREEHAVLREEKQELRDEVARLKGLKAKPDIKPSGLDKGTCQRTNQEANQNGDGSGGGSRQRAGLAKRAKTANLEIHQEVVIQPAGVIPPGACFKGDRDFVVQELILSTQNPDTVSRNTACQTARCSAKSDRQNGMAGTLARSDAPSFSIRIPSCANGGWTSLSGR